MYNTGPVTSVVTLTMTMTSENQQEDRDDSDGDTTNQKAAHRYQNCMDTGVSNY